MKLTLAPLPATQPDLTDITDNSTFLTAIFRGLEPEERPMVLSVVGDPNDKKTDWSDGTGWTPDTNTTDVGVNSYFTLSTYQPKDGKYRRQRTQFLRAFGVMLDDIGTKAAPRERLNACPPSYLIETSSGNYQAGYLFDVPVADVKQVEALQESLVEAGLCDEGAKGPSARIGRLPFGINGKHSPPFRCRLVEWSPERRYSVDQIVDRLELAPVQPSGTRKKTRTSSARHDDDGAAADVYRPRANENAVVAALRRRGLYKKPLGDGKHDITCPWVGEHTDGVDHGTAYLEPSDLFPVGGFRCQHSHGASRRIGALLEFLGLTFTEAKHKPTIRVAAGELHRVVDAAERELASCGRYYQRGGLIVSVGTDPATAETRIKPVNANALSRSLSSCATWERFDARTSDFVLTDPPPGTSTFCSTAMLTSIFPSCTASPDSRTSGPTAV